MVSWAHYASNLTRVWFALQHNVENVAFLAACGLARYAASQVVGPKEQGGPTFMIYIRSQSLWT